MQEETSWTPAARYPVDVAVASLLSTYPDFLPPTTTPHTVQPRLSVLSLIAPHTTRAKRHWAVQSAALALYRTLYLFYEGRGLYNHMSSRKIFMLWLGTNSILTVALCLQLCTVAPPLLVTYLHLPLSLFAFLAAGATPVPHQ